jgi:hypothetical protein
MTKIDIVTLSFAGDFDVCKTLCATVDRFVPQDIMHRLYVPRSDLQLFQSLANDRCHIYAQEDLLPWWFCKVPLPSPIWRKRLFLPRRNVYITPFSLPVRGWITQQIMKIAATATSPADVVIHMDSDTTFIRPFKPEHIVIDGLTRFYRDPNPTGLATHTTWQKAARQLLGLAANPNYEAEYIGACLVWKTSVLRDMIQQMEKGSGSSWIKTLARSPHFAEYVLYGVYVDQIAGLEKTGLYTEDFSLCLTRWADPIENDKDLGAFIDELQSYHLACTIQSTIGSSMIGHAAIVEKVIERAAEQDRHSTAT